MRPKRQASALCGHPIILISHTRGSLVPRAVRLLQHNAFALTTPWISLGMPKIYRFLNAASAFHTSTARAHRLTGCLGYSFAQGYRQPMRKEVQQEMETEAVLVPLLAKEESPRRA